MARTITSQIGASQCGNCAECGALVNFELNRDDMELAEGFDEWMHPRAVYRDCPECGTEDATILIS